MQGGLPRPPEIAAVGTSFPSDAPVAVETHLSPQGSDLAALDGPVVQSVAEAVDDARLGQTSANGIAMVAGTQGEAASSLEDRRKSTRVACNTGVSWADAEDSGGDGSNSGVGCDLRAPRADVVT